MEYILKKTISTTPKTVNKTDKLFILIDLFIKNGSITSWKPQDWSRERGAAKKLMNKYKDFDFFYSLTHLNGKFNSLLGLLYNKYEDINAKYESFILAKERNPVYTIQEENKKAKDVMDLFDN